MIRFQRTVGISRGKYAEAMAWAKELVDYMNENVSGPDVRVLTPRFGQRNMIIWEGEYDDYAAFAEHDAALRVHDGVQQKIASSGDLFVESSLVDTILEYVG